MLLADSEHDLCPMGCGRTTEDPYGGPCKACWAEVEPERSGYHQDCHSIGGPPSGPRAI